MIPLALAVTLAMQWFGGREPNTQEGAEHYEAGRLEEALRAFARARGAHPEAVENDLNIAGVQYRMGEAGTAGATGGAESSGPFAEALRGYQAAIGAGAAGTTRRDSFFNLGNTLYRMGAFREAASAYAEASALDPEDREARQNLERALRRAEEQAGKQAGKQEGQEPDQEQDRTGEDEPPQQPQEGQDPQDSGARGDQEDEHSLSESAGEPSEPDPADPPEEQAGPSPLPEDGADPERPQEGPEGGPPPQSSGVEGAPEGGSVPEISPRQADRILAALAEIERAWQEDQLEKRRARALRRGRH